MQLVQKIINAQRYLQQYNKTRNVGVLELIVYIAGR